MQKNRKTVPVLVRVVNFGLVPTMVPVAINDKLKEDVLDVCMNRNHNLI